MPRIVILDTGNPEEVSGGQSVFIRTLLPRLPGQTCIVGATGRKEPLGKLQRRSLNGVPYDFMAVARMPPPGLKPVVPLRFASLLGVTRYRREILRAGDVMYVQSPEMGLPLTFGTIRKPIVLHLHGAANPLTASRYPWARHRLMRQLYARVLDRVVENSRLVLSVDEAGLCNARKRLIVNKTQLVIVPVCVDEHLFFPGDRSIARAVLHLPPSDRIVLFVGRLEEDKGTAQLIRILQLLETPSQRVSLVIAGDGSQRVAIRAQAQQSGLSERVVFAGWVPHDDLASWLRASDVLLLPSLHEGLPTVVLEALACGIPVVASQVGGLPRLVQEGTNGVLVDDRTPEAFAAALRTVLATGWCTSDIVASAATYSADRVAARVVGLLSQAAA